MGGIFGVASKNDCVMEVFFGTDYHSHLGTYLGGLAFYHEGKFERAIHHIESTPFRSKFDKEVAAFKGNMGIGCISDTDAQPLLVRSHLGVYAITTVGKLHNIKALTAELLKSKDTHFLEMSGGELNQTEVVSALINTGASYVEGIAHAQDLIKGSCSLLLLTAEGLYAARDLYGRTPIVLGEKEGAYCATLESCAMSNVGFHPLRELGPGEIVRLSPEGVETLLPPRGQLHICTFMWTYFGYPSSSYEGMNVEKMRYGCGAKLAQRDGPMDLDSVAGIPDSGTAHAIGYANESKVPFARPFVKYTPTWPRSFMPQNQSTRNLVAHMKMMAVDELIRNKNLLFCDDSVVRGTQMRETVQFLYESGAKNVHVRSACPPLLFGCKYLNFSRSASEMDLIARRVIMDIEGKITPELLQTYTNPHTPQYEEMVALIGKRLNFTTLKYQLLEDMVDVIGLPRDHLCTYCWTGCGGKKVEEKSHA